MDLARIFFAAIGFALALPSAALADGCQNLSPPHKIDGALKHPVTAEDLIGLRDIGPISFGDPRAGLLRVSPDGHSIAFQMRRADLPRNSYCFGIFVLGLSSNGAPRLVDAGGEFIPLVVNMPYSNVHVGDPATITPKWSPDGTWVAFLRRDHGVTQVWRAQTDGGGSNAISHLDFDVDDFAWLDGNRLVISARPGIVASLASVSREAKTGYHYDDRFMPTVANTPLPSASIQTEYFTISAADGVVRPATPVEQAALTGDIRQQKSATMAAAASDGGTASVVPDQPGNITSFTRLRIAFSGAVPKPCDRPECTEISDLWFTPDGHTLAWLRRDKGADISSLYRWDKGAAAPVKVLDETGVLLGCQMAEADLVCAQEEPTQPRRLVEIDLHTSRVSILFDPNPEFQQLQLGAWQRIHWTNNYGVQTYGDLILPPDHKPGEKHPLIMVGYNARGFLRGGTGNAYPILYFAAHGYAVLAYQVPLDIGYFRGARTYADLDRIARIDWDGFKSAQSALEKGIIAASALGDVDPGRVGLTGLSYGASIAQFAAVNSSAFKAVAISNCCEEASVFDFLTGPLWGRYTHARGYPAINEQSSQFWRGISLRTNATTVRTPILMQLPDREYLGALESVSALSAAGAPVDMYVYPDEYHIFWQPQHRLALFRRSLQWFDFWLKGDRSPCPVDTDEYADWEKLRPSSGNVPAPRIVETSAC